jgi:phage shock protein E
MISLIKKIFGIGPGVDYVALMQAGAQIVDVRTKGEYAGGHIPGSKNIPLQSLSLGTKQLNKNKPVITCCASGIRSASAKGMLKAHGFTDVHNGGSWFGLMKKINP